MLALPGPQCPNFGTFVQVLRQTARLRYAAADHVRSLAAQALGFLLRQAPAPALRSGLRAVLAGTTAAQHSARPCSFVLLLSVLSMLRSRIVSFRA